MNDYKKSIIQPPKSYEELNKNRPTKKRNFTYSMQDDQPPAPAKPTPSYAYHSKNDFSFEHKESKAVETPKPREREVKELELRSKYDYLPEEKKASPKKEKVKDELYNSPSKRHDIDQRLNNISSINDKISGLLNVTRNKKQEERSLNSSPLKEKSSLAPDQSYMSKQDQTYTSRYVYDQEASHTSRAKPSFKSKYAYTPDEELPEIPRKELLSKKYLNDSNFMSATVNEKKYDYDFNSKVGGYTSKVAKDSPIKDSISITPYKDLDPKESKITSKVEKTKIER